MCAAGNCGLPTFWTKQYPLFFYVGLRNPFQQACGFIGATGRQFGQVAVVRRLKGGPVFEGKLKQAVAALQAQFGADIGTVRFHCAGADE